MEGSLCQIAEEVSLCNVHSRTEIHKQKCVCGHKSLINTFIYSRFLYSQIKMDTTWLRAKYSLAGMMKDWEEKSEYYQQSHPRPPISNWWSSSSQSFACYILLFEIHKHPHPLQGGNTNVHILTFQTLSMLISIFTWYQLYKHSRITVIELRSTKKAL